MPFNGSGVFSIVNTFVPGTTIFSSAVNANFTDIATGLSSCMLKDGTQTITANIPMAGFGFTGVGSLGSQAVITVASATTTDILSQSSLLIAISGVVTITSFGADAAARRNQIKFVRATGAFTITYNVTSMITPTAADIVCAAGDTFVVISDASSNSRIYAFQRASGYALIAYPGFRNKARRNGGFELWQRGAGGAASFAIGASTTAYTADGWYIVTGANQASIVSQQAGITDSSQWCAKYIRNSGQTGTTAPVFGFPLDTDEIYPILGQFVRLSFTAKAGANWSPSGGNLSALVTVGTGTPVKLSVGFTGGTTAIGLVAALTTSATRFQASSAAVVPTTTRQAEITFTWTPAGTAGGDDSFYIDDVQLEVVPDASQGASPFERLFFTEQLLLCQRHFYKTFLYATAPAQNVGINTGEFQFLAGKAGAGLEFGPGRFPVSMRIAPTLTSYNPAVTNAQVRDLSASVDCSSVDVGNGITTLGWRIGATGNASTAVGGLLGVHFIADAGI